MEEKWLEHLNPQFRDKIIKFDQVLKAYKLFAKPTCAYRSIQAQNELYAQGRTKPGKRVTNARGGQSAHNSGCAMDWVPLVDGKANYNVPEAWWQKFGHVVRENGLDWGGDWARIKDRPHVELPGWQKLHH